MLGVSGPLVMRVDSRAENAHVRIPAMADAGGSLEKFATAMRTGGRARSHLMLYPGVLSLLGYLLVQWLVDASSGSSRVWDLLWDLGLST